MTGEDSSLTLLWKYFHPPLGTWQWLRGSCHRSCHRPRDLDAHHRKCGQCHALLQSWWSSLSNVETCIYSRQRLPLGDTASSLATWFIAWPSPPTLIIGGDAFDARRNVFKSWPCLLALHRPPQWLVFYRMALFPLAQAPTHMIMSFLFARRWYVLNDAWEKSTTHPHLPLTTRWAYSTFLPIHSGCSWWFLAPLVQSWQSKGGHRYNQFPPAAFETREDKLQCHFNNQRICRLQCKWN